MLFKIQGLAWADGLAILGVAVAFVSGLSFLVKFSTHDEAAAKAESEKMLAPLASEAA